LSEENQQRQLEAATPIFWPPRVRQGTEEKQLQFYTLPCIRSACSIRLSRSSNKKHVGSQLKKIARPGLRLFLHFARFQGGDFKQYICT
jgi:hypothetical protein